MVDVEFVNEVENSEKLDDSSLKCTVKSYSSVIRETTLTLLNKESNLLLFVLVDIRFSP